MAEPAPESTWRAERVERLASEYGLTPGHGVGRYAAVVTRGDHRALVQGDDIAELLRGSELVVLINLDAAARAHPDQGHHCPRGDA